MEKIRGLEEELEVCRSRHETSQSELTSSCTEIAALQAKIEAMERVVDPSSLPPCQNVIRMREIQSRVQTLALAFNS